VESTQFEAYIERGYARTQELVAQERSRDDTVSR
jgi:hypothetical protein